MCNAFGASGVQTALISRTPNVCTTPYTERLLRNLDLIDWSESTKIAQRNWIGRSDGAAIDFPVAICFPIPVAGSDADRDKVSWRSSTSVFAVPPRTHGVWTPPAFDTCAGHRPHRETSVVG